MRQRVAPPGQAGKCCQNAHGGGQRQSVPPLSRPIKARMIFMPAHGLIANRPLANSASIWSGRYHQRPDNGAIACTGTATVNITAFFRLLRAGRLSAQCLHHSAKRRPSAALSCHKWGRATADGFHHPASGPHIAIGHGRQRFGNDAAEAHMGCPKLAAHCA